MKTKLKAQELGRTQTFDETKSLLKNSTHDTKQVSFEVNILVTFEFVNKTAQKL